MLRSLTCKDMREHLLRPHILRMYTPTQILAKVDLLPIENNSEKRKRPKKYKSYQILRRLVVVLLLFT